MKSCYNRCIKLFFGFSKFHSVTNMLLELGFSSFDTVLCNSKSLFLNRLCNCTNGIIQYLLKCTVTFFCYVIIIIIYLLHKSIQRTKYSNMNSGAGQQGKALTAVSVFLSCSLVISSLDFFLLSA